MRAVVGLLCILAAALWLRRIGGRGGKGRSFTQAVIDFATGAPRESVLVIGLLLFGVILVAAHFLAP
jgi:hypothetical protein